MPMLFFSPTPLATQTEIGGLKRSIKPAPRFPCRSRQRVQVVADMSFRRIDREDGDEELFDSPSAVSGGADSDADNEDHFPEAGAGAGDHNRMYVPQPLRRMNSDSIYDMSSMTAQLPPAKKKGLSRYYEGRSQSFACMSDVHSLEDLQKKDNPYKQKIKACKSYAALRGMSNPKTSSNSSSCANLNIVAADGFRATPIHVNKNGYHQ